MNAPLHDISRRTAAQLAGIGLLITLGGVIIAAACGAPPDLATSGDPAAIAQRIAASGDLFRVAAAGWLVALLGDVLRAWALYVFFRPVNRSVALLSAWAMLLHAAVFGAANIGLLLVPDVLNGATDQAQALMMLLLHGNHFGFMTGLFFFSFHLLLLGYLALRSGTVPKVLGYLVLLAGLGYLVDSIGHIAMPHYPQLLSTVLAVPNTIGELAFIAWLALRGGKGAE